MFNQPNYQSTVVATFVCFAPWMLHFAHFSPSFSLCHFVFLSLNYVSNYCRALLCVIIIIVFFRHWFDAPVLSRNCSSNSRTCETFSLHAIHNWSAAATATRRMSNVPKVDLWNHSKLPTNVSKPTYVFSETERRCRVIAAQYSISPLCSLTTWMPPAHKGRRREGEVGGATRKQHVTVLKGILNATIRCVALLTRKAVAMANQQSTDNTDSTDNTQHSWLPFWNAQMKRKLRRREALESESPAQHTLLHSPNNATANQFRFSAASWPTWPTVLLASSKQ